MEGMKNRAAATPVDDRSAFAVPDHVPDALIYDFDYLSTDIEYPVHDWWMQLYAGPEIIWTPRNGGHWVFTRNHLISRAFDDIAHFSNEGMTIPREVRPFALPPASADPPLHSDYRKLVQPFFSMKSIAELEARARQLSIELIEAVTPQGSCEFIHDLALKMPIGIFMSMVDLPDSDRDYLVQCADDMVRGTDDRGFVNAAAYLNRVFEERRRKPGRDMISAIVQGTVEGGRPLNAEELTGMGVLLLAGGLDTVAAMMGFVATHLAEHPEHRRLLRDRPDRMPRAIEELMRRYSLVNIGRMVVSDIIIGGVQLKAGDLVLLPTPLGGLDAQQYQNPEQVDFDRKERHSLIFGRGPHMCLGQFLARTELRVFFHEWLSRIPEFDIAPGARVTAVPGRVNFVRSLPLAWPI